MKKAIESVLNTNGNSEKLTESEDIESPNSNIAWPREALVAQASYLAAEQGGFGPGIQLADWLRAEADVTAKTSQP